MEAGHLTPLAGGWSGETFVAEVAGERSVVRLYSRPSHRGEAAPEVDAALLRLVRGLVPVPEVLEVRRADRARSRPGMLVTSFLPGTRGDLVMPALDDAALAVLGGRLGVVLADLGGMPMLAAGRFLDGSLAVGPFGGPDDLAGFLTVQRRALVRRPAWTSDLLARLRGICVAAQDLLDEVGRTCLVHSDFNPKNLLVDPDLLVVTGVLDWEFAHAGHPFTDLGNLVRFERRPAFVDAVLAVYADRRGTPPAEALELARAADLWALLDLAARAGENPVADAAERLLLAIAARGDLHAVPEG